ncbi:MAG: polyribonucleotide nucleotidyltransferase, polyribonucleotide nucleotidyltransferase [candidate division WWE3 bacterium GW2011_GWC1_47_10]|nr:MAG: polyribonucleotide nucleotidyltransferase, polyribonucleotide nucleotidyltransferase [candidate division WWE3 bacterium GW2011_GWC1_47_10]
MIPVEKIGVVIGSGGKTIKDIEAKTGATLGIEPDGTVVIAAATSEGLNKAVSMVEALVKDIEVGSVYEGVVKNTTDFGAFVEILPGREGLLHVSELSHKYVTNVEDEIKPGDKVRVKVLAAENGRISLSKKALEGK